MPKSQGLKIVWIKSNRFNRPETNFYHPKEDKNLISELLKPSLFEKNCQKVCSKKIELLPPTTVDAHSGLGYYMINVDGFRYLNAYIISDPLSSSTMRGFTLEISFSINDFV